MMVFVSRWSTCFFHVLLIGGSSARHVTMRNDDVCESGHCPKFHVAEQGMVMLQVKTDNTAENSTVELVEGGAPWGEQLALKVVKKLEEVMAHPEQAVRQLGAAYECIVRSGANLTKCEDGRKLSSGELPDAPKFLRLGFHDCVKYADGSGGCDACINLEGMFTKFKPAADDTKLPPGVGMAGNNNLALTADVLERIYTDPAYPANSPKLHRSLHEGGQSRADLWALATLYAARRGMVNNNRVCNKTSRNIYKNLGKPELCRLTPSRPMKFYSGRADCPSSFKADPNDQSKFYRRRAYETLKAEHEVNAHSDGKSLQRFFEDVFGMDARETVAIMGAHSFGTFNSGSSMFKYTWKRGTSELLSNEYYRLIALMPHYNKQTKPGGWHVVGGPGRTETNFSGALAKTRWLVRARDQTDGHGPFQWSHQYLRCPDCSWDGNWTPIGHSNEGGPGFRSERCCKECTKQPGDPTIPDACLRWVSQEEEASSVDAGLYLDFSFDPQSGRPTGCDFPDHFTNTKHQRGWTKKSHAPKGCQKQQLESKGDREPKMMYQIVEQYADNQNIWIDDFMPSLEKMLSNGADSLQEEFSFPGPDDEMQEPDPEPGCVDKRDNRMKNKGVHCATWSSVKKCTVCVNNDRWRQKKLCQYSCYQAGCGYKGDVCDMLREQ